VIVSFSRRFVFLKTRKTAGTSVETALSRACGDTDVIGPLAAPDEELRVRVGGRPAQHHRGVNPHMRALDVRLIGHERFRAMTKIAIERNPWDMVVSQYFWVMNHWESRGLERIPFRQFVLDQRHPERLAAKSARVYRIAGTVVANRLLRYETLDDDLARVWKELELPGYPELPRAKGDTRLDRRPYAELYDEEIRDRVAELFAETIDELGYEF